VLGDDGDRQEIGDIGAAPDVFRLVEAEQDEAPAGTGIVFIDEGEDARVVDPPGENGAVVPEVRVDLTGDPSDPLGVFGCRAADRQAWGFWS
jgi:hypothetical protein